MEPAGLAHLDLLFSICRMSDRPPGKLLRENYKCWNESASYRERMCPSNHTVVSQSPTHRATRITFLPSSGVGTRIRVFPDPGPVCFPLSPFTPQNEHALQLSPSSLCLSHSRGSIPDQHWLRYQAVSKEPGTITQTREHSAFGTPTRHHFCTSEWGAPRKELWENCSSSVGL